MTADERDARLAAIRARWAAATRGPWQVDERDPELIVGNIIDPYTGDDYREPVAQMWGSPPEIDPRANAEAIAHAPQDVAWLIAELERLTAELHRCRVEVEEMADGLGLPEDDREPPPLGG